MSKRELNLQFGVLLWERVNLLNNGTVPREAFAHLSAQDWFIWLTEPDSNQFPPQLAHLKPSLTETLDTCLPQHFPDVP